MCEEMKTNIVGRVIQATLACSESVSEASVDCSGSISKSVRSCIGKGRAESISVKFKDYKKFTRDTTILCIKWWRQVAVDEATDCQFISIHGGAEHKTLHKGLLIQPADTEEWFRIDLSTDSKSGGTLSCVCQAGITDFNVDGPKDGCAQFVYKKRCSLMDILNAVANVMASSGSYNILHNNCMTFVDLILRKLGFRLYFSFIC